MSLIRRQLTQPVIGSCEHDPLLLCQANSKQCEEDWPEPPPSASSVVDAAIDLFSALLPLQDTTSTTKVVSELIEYTRSPKLERNSGRKAAVLVNVAVAITLSLRAASTSHARHCRDTLGSHQISSILSSFLKVRVFARAFNVLSLMYSVPSECTRRWRPNPSFSIK